MPMPTQHAADLMTAAPDRLRAATDEGVARARAGIEEFLAAGDLPAAEQLDLYDEAVAAAMNVAHQMSVIRNAHPDAEHRSTAEAASRDLDAVLTEISLDERVFAALSALDLTEAEPVTVHWVTRTLRDMRLSGVDRDAETRARVRSLKEELVRIGQDFDRNIAGDTRTESFSPQELAGLPDDFIAAHAPGADGRVEISTAYPDKLPFLTYATSSAARERLWRTDRLRGVPANVDSLAEMVRTRHELATLLGFPNWAEYATADKMIGSAGAAADFIERLSDAAADRMRADYAVLLERKRRDDPAATAVEAWDGTYLQDQVRSEQFAFDSQAVRPYFEYTAVKDGIFDLVGRMFGVSFEQRTDVPVWHPEVEVYDIRRDGAAFGRFFLDMHPRADKFSHAAMFRVVVGKAGVRAPQCALLCNLPRPGERPALLLPNEVQTFFHEFGHLIHHLFASDIAWSGLTSMAIERDFIEAPSQLLEEWMKDAPTLAGFAKHHETGEPLPAELVEKMRAADEFGKGLFVRQQLFYSALSLGLHTAGPDADAAGIERAAQAAHSPWSYVEGTSLFPSFGHLGGYSAYYYAYLWSLVISKDLFTAFDPADLAGSEVAGRYRDAVLAPGSGKPAAELVSDFLGRPYTFDAFEKWLNA
ncbi:M3 family metallopeptidase [Hamadaea tsunoensis]|uniref:M3 family metallopeptidase n=1 Tax=Hamadaea tsunoensis TaxID=53368 RepID=UPI00040576E3|nr:M3 family metallopeptidase [Hamadaea tsunoensis]